MEQVEITIKNSTGLHTRPGGLFVKKAKEFESKITIDKGEKSADGKSLIKLLKLGISKGDHIKISAEGPDEKQTIKILAEFINELKE